MQRRQVQEEKHRRRIYRQQRAHPPHLTLDPSEDSPAGVDKIFAALFFLEKLGRALHLPQLKVYHPLLCIDVSKFGQAACLLKYVCPSLEPGYITSTRAVNRMHKGRDCVTEPRITQGTG
jgi:hypothetical protein